MSIVVKPTKPKKPRLPYLGVNLSVELEEKITQTFNAVAIRQHEHDKINKSDLIRDALERGLNEINQQLEATNG
jgi:metal-responsive CopG/Arc/MetJ family transcriptional regulator